MFFHVTNHFSWATLRLMLMMSLISLLGACSSVKYTVDDGRKVDEVLLGHIRTYGTGEQVLRPAIARTAALKDADCDKQWELPFSVATSYDESEDDRVAWVRALGVDERLTVVGVAADSPLKLRDKIQEIAGVERENSQKMLLHLTELRDAGEPFDVKLSSNKVVKIKPFQVCRGYARLAPPSSPKLQDYHWLMTVHPLQVAEANLTDDEALWLVLWGQGVSEEAGARMKTYHYGSKIVGTLYNLFTIASGLQGAAAAAQAAMNAAKSAASSVASDIIRKQIMDQATAFGVAQMRKETIGVVKTLTQQQVMAALQQAAVNRGSLSGVAWVASTKFEDADVWAYNRVEKLNANPLAAFSLHQKLVERGLTANSMIMDNDRLKALNQLAEKRGRGDDVVAILQGIKPNELQFELKDMPLASAPSAFSYDSISDMSPAQSTELGLIDTMLSMPVASTTTK